jgi:hypothetical protein
LGVAADHQAISAFQAPHAAACAGVDIKDAFFLQRLGAPDIVLIKGVAAVDDDVSGFEQLAERHHRLFGDVARRKHHPHHARLFELGDKAGQILTAFGAGLDQRLDGTGLLIEDDAAMAGPHQPPRDVAAHAAETDDADLHVVSPLRNSGVSIFS